MRFSLLLCAVAMLLSPLQAQEAEAVSYDYKDDVEQIRSSLIGRRYSEGISGVQDLLAKLLQKRREDIASFFPGKYKEFRVRNLHGEGGDIFQSQSENGYGVLFSRRYSDRDGKTIDVNVVYSDPDIVEYLNIIQNPELVDGLENTEIIKEDDLYVGIEKFSSDDKYLERNLILNSDLQVNVVANGFGEKLQINDFISQISLRDLETYLEKE